MRKTLVLAGVFVLGPGAVLFPAPAPAQRDAALAAAVEGGGIGLDDVLESVEAGGSAPIEAVADLDREGRLCWSVLAGRPSAPDSGDDPGFRILSGPVSGSRWFPTTGAVTGAVAVARAARAGTLLALSPLTLAELAARVRETPPRRGSVISIRPVLLGRTPALEAVFAGAAPGTAILDLATGRELPVPTAPVRIAVKAHETVASGGCVIEYGCSSETFLGMHLIGSPFPSARIAIVGRGGREMDVPAVPAGGWRNVDLPPAFGPATEVLVFPPKR